MKALTILLASALLSLNAAGGQAIAEEYFYWPEFGTLASHNDWGAKAVFAPEAQAAGASGSGIKVAFLDDGLSATSSNLQSKVVAYKDFIPGYFNRAEHGSYVASTIAADYNSEYGIRGIAPGVSLMVGRVCQHDSCYWDAIREGFAWAVNQGADIISMSFSGSADPEMHAAILAATQKGVVVVGSLGNIGCGPYGYWGMNTGCTKTKTSTESSQMSYPIAGALGVGASDQRGGRYATVNWSSSYGPNLDILAPGTDTSGYDHFGASNGFGGTSASAPIVAGVAALILEANPLLEPDQVQAILQASASPAYEEPLKVWDSCVKNAETNVWSCNQIVDSDIPQQYLTGAGVVNALAAVQLARKSAKGKLFEEVSISQQNSTLTFTWDGGPADLYLNSKLIMKNAISGYQYQGFENQSIAVQLKRGGQESLPKLAIVKQSSTTESPIIATAGYLDNERNVRFDVTNYAALADSVWRKSQRWSNYYEIAGLYTFTDGTDAACKATIYPISSNAHFLCKFQPGRTSFTGRFRLLGKYSDFGEYSLEINPHNPNYPDPFPVSISYPDSGLPTFSWQPVSGALSYQFRYEPDLNYYCTTDTSFSVPAKLRQPSIFVAIAFSGENCSGEKVNTSETLSWVSQPPKPAKPEGITVSYIGYEEIDFEIPNRDPAASYRIYRSDGQMVRIMPSQQIRLGITSNEEVNGKTFTYRFIQVDSDAYAESWSEPSDPITVSFRAFAAPSAECFKLMSGNRVQCDVLKVQDSHRTRIEYLDSDFEVISATETSQARNQDSDALFRVATYVRVVATRGDANTKYSWYRRGESKIVPIVQTRNNRFVEVPR